jgi:hypothetical protein
MRSINPEAKKLKNRRHAILSTLLFWLSFVVFSIVLPIKISWAVTVNAPSNLTGTVVSSNQINLSWKDNSTNETGFNVERSTVSSGPYSVIADLGANVTTYSDKGLTQNTTYYYRVQAYNTSTSGTVYSSYTSVVSKKTASLAAPSTLTAAVISSTQIKLSWRDNTSYETAYEIERATSTGGPYSVIGSVGVNVITYADTVPAQNTTYYYRVRAYDGTNYSLYSSVVNATIIAITASAGTGGAISPSGAVWVKPGASQTFTITSNAGYQIASVIVDGVSVGAKSTYTFTNVTTGHTIMANFTDVTPPTGSITINSGAAFTNSLNVVLTLSAADSGSGVAQMQFSNDGLTWSAPEPFASTKSWTLASNDGPKTVSVKYKDNAGNWSISYSSSITLDTTAPAVTISSPAAGIINTKTPLLTYTVSDGTVVVKVDGVVVSKASGATLDPLADGPHSVHVEATDAAGNTGFAEVNFTVDTSVTINPVTTPTDLTTQTITGTMKSGAVIMATIDTPAAVGPVTYPTSTTWSCTITGLALGANNIVVTSADATGKRGTAKASIVVGPGLAGLWRMNGDWTDASGYGNGGTGYGAVTFTPYAHIGSQAASFDGVDDSVLAGNGYIVSAPNTFTISFWAYPSGSIGYFDSESSSCRYSQTGNFVVYPWYSGSVRTYPSYSGSADVGVGVSLGRNSVGVYEGCGPSVSYFAPLLVYSGSIQGWTNIVVVYVNKQPSLYINGQFIKSGLVSSHANVYPSTRFGGSPDYQGYNGNGFYNGYLEEVAIYNRALTADEILKNYNAMAAPTVTITSPAAGLTNDNTPFLRYNASYGTVVVKVDGIVVPKVSGDRLNVLLDGTHTVRVECTDTAGNKGFAETTFTVDTLTPILVINPVTTPTHVNSQTITGSKTSDAVVMVSVNTAAVPGPVSYPTPTTWSCTITGLAKVANDITVTATNAARNTSTAMVSITLYGLTISNVSISTNTINTYASESANIFFTIDAPATATLKIIPEKQGPTGAPVYQTSRTCTAAGAYLFTWDGKDSTGKVVPDEAYLYIIEASNGTYTDLYSPPASPGTGSISCSQGASYDPYRNDPLAISYSISQLVRVDLSIKGIFKVMDSVPHVPGSYTFDWNGRGPDGSILVAGATAQCAVATLLRENVIITSGNTPKVTLLKTDPYDIQLSYGEFTRIRYALSRDANVTVTLSSPTGTTITLLNGQSQTAGAHEIQWYGSDQSDTSGKKLLISQEGDYTVSIQVVNSASGASSVAKGCLRIWR